MPVIYPTACGSENRGPRPIAFTNRPKRVRLPRNLTVQYRTIQFFNRYTGQIETEEVYGEPYMRWTYGTRLGKLACTGWPRSAFFRRWYGCGA